MNDEFLDEDMYDADRTARFILAAHDRGMVKWQGFYLADHTKVIEQLVMNEQRQEQLVPRQSLSEMSAIMGEAMHRHQQVSIQQAVVNSDQITLPSIKGYVQGYDDEGFFVDNYHIAYTDLWHVTRDM